MKYSFLTNSKVNYVDSVDKDVRFVEQWQLKDATLWTKFVNQFVLRVDSTDRWWRGEFWGKMMRGACLTYAYTHDQELYQTLTDAVTALLKTQDNLGRISAYTVETEFDGWDMWGRKYVLTGMLHFYDICTDQSLKQRIVKAMTLHADYIVAHVGNGKGQKPITQTSEFWGGVNSCSILDAIINLYVVTNDDKYLQFAEYVLSTGGCGKGSLVDATLAGKLPHQFPIDKAYEMMSFFEGVLSYYQVTGNDYYLNVVAKFFDLVRENEISIIGCAGCTHELFDNTVNSQIVPSDVIMQETCVTVTYLRVMTKLLLLTGDVKYANAIETPIYNAMPGSINYAKQPGKTYWGVSIPTPPMPFDSYSPLLNQKRGGGVGGYIEFEKGDGYGCCACIGSAGVALDALTAFLSSKDGFVVNEIYNGTIETAFDGNDVKFDLSSSLNGSKSICLSLSKPQRFEMAIRVPTWCKDATVVVGNDEYACESGKYCAICREWKNGDVINVSFLPTLRHVINGDKVAFCYGAYVLAFDRYKQNVPYDEISVCVKPSYDYKLLAVQDLEHVRLTVNVGTMQLLLTDYASCGKKWTEDNSEISVWLSQKR